jgi:hypothetical protein
VAIVPVDDRDLGLFSEAAPELVGDQSAAGAGAEDEDASSDEPLLPGETLSESGLNRFPRTVSSPERGEVLGTGERSSQNTARG